MTHTHTNLSDCDCDSPALADHLKPPYERVGGAAAVRAVVDRLYQRVLAHPDLGRYFVHLGTDDISRVKRHQVQLISHVLGGPATYDIAALGSTHSQLAIVPAHYRLTVHLLVGTLWELAVPEDIIFDVTELMRSLEPVIAGVGGPEAQAA